MAPPDQGGRSKSFSHQPMFFGTRISNMNDAPPEQKQEGMLLGSSRQPSTWKLKNGEQLQLGQVVLKAFQDSALTVTQWNELPDEDREVHIETALEKFDIAEEEKPQGEGVKVQMLATINGFGKYGQVVIIPEREVRRLGSNVSRKIDPEIVPSEDYLEHGETPIAHEKIEKVTERDGDPRAMNAHEVMKNNPWYRKQLANMKGKKPDKTE